MSIEISKGASMDEISSIEKAIGIRFSGQYKRFLKEKTDCLLMVLDIVISHSQK